MRHRVKSVKLGRTSQHRDLMLANQAGSLIQHGRIKTTLAKAKALRPIVEKLVTLGKKGGLHSRRVALSRLINNEDWVKKLFGEIAPRFQDRNGGYTRILKLGLRNSDASSMALIEWVDNVVEAVPAAADGEEKKAEAKA
ncbi:MAG: 50S ribosomal protein L17 [Verrucomicrobiales bacterium]|nr:50S ribosomal protein L17 [Verrucomicrobiales bacterium]